MNEADRRDPFAELKRDTESYRVFDEHYENVGRVDDLFVDEDDRPLYVGVKTGLLGMSSTLVPVEIVRVNDRRGVVEIAETSEQIKHAPSLGEGEELTPELEEKVRVHFGLRGPRTFADDGPADRTTDERVDLVPGERRASETFEAPPPPSQTPEPVQSDTEPGKEWARGTEGHEAERRDPGRGTRVRRPRR